MTFDLPDSMPTGAVGWRLKDDEIDPKTKKVKVPGDLATTEVDGNTVTVADGDYVFTVLAAGITDLAGNTVTMGNLVLAIVVFYLFVVSAWIIKQVMVHYLPARLNAEVGVVESGATIVNYTLLVVGIIVALGILGLDLFDSILLPGSWFF